MHTQFCLLAVILLLVPSLTNAQTESRIMPDPRIDESISLMQGFAEHTGLISKRPERRYLWTDAFAVCNFLGLARLTGEPQYTELALQLVEHVHHTLGKHRSDDTRSGWISGLSKREGELHPTRGGLRIGKTLPERGPDEPFDEQLEWDRDGQYYHYLTKWMHALDQVTRSTRKPHFNVWARELAEAASNAFTYSSNAAGSPHRMYWKMSTDLSRALVPSMGQHDPLDGYITYVQLESTATTSPNPDTGPKLANEISQLSAMIDEDELATGDPLGIGGLLTDAYRVYQLSQQGAKIDKRLLEILLSASLSGLQYYTRGRDLRLPAEYRLAFRELGLAIGLHAVERMWQTANSGVNRSSLSAEARAQLQALTEYTPMCNEIESFWRNPEHRNADTWSEHRDINEVMLATSLAPEGFLILVFH